MITSNVGMDFEEWLEANKFQLTRRYKIKNMICNSQDGLWILFENGFQYQMSRNLLYGIWNNNMYHHLNNNIEKEFLSQIRKEL